MKYLGIDIGGTKIEAALIGFSDQKGQDRFRVGFAKKRAFGRIIKRQRTPTRRLQGYGVALASMEKLVRDVCKEAQIELNDIRGLGICLPGTVHPRTRQMLMGNTAMFVGKDPAADLKNRLGINGPVACENDANCFAYAESLCGAGAVYEKETGVPFCDQSVVGLILGTGVGSGVVINGRMVRGRFGGAGEAGHTELFTAGHPCYCGKNGCAEQYLSGPALEAAFANRMYSQIPRRPSARDIFVLARKKDPVAIAVVRQYKRHLVKFLTNLTNVFDPDYFVLGGGMSNPKEILEGLEAALDAQTFVPLSNPKIFRHQLGDSAGVIGCVLPLLEAALMNRTV